MRRIAVALYLNLFERFANAAQLVREELHQSGADVLLFRETRNDVPKVVPSAPPRSTVTRPASDSIGARCVLPGAAAVEILPVSFAPLNALSAFLAVARRRSFAAAARDLGVSTSALSQSVRQLEERVGLALLTRTSRSVALTDAGQRLLETAGPAVDGALEALETVTAKPGELTGRIKFSVPGAAVALGSRAHLRLCVIAKRCEYQQKRASDGVREDFRTAQAVFGGLLRIARSAFFLFTKGHEHRASAPIKRLAIASEHAIATVFELGNGRSAERFPTSTHSRVL